MKKRSQINPVKKIFMREWTYAEFLPCKELQDIVACYWHIVLHKNNRQRLSPDGYTDVIFDFQAGTIIVAGLIHKPYMADLTEGSRFIGVKLRTGAFYSLFRSPAGFFADRMVSLKSLIGEDSRRFEKVFSAKTFPARLRIIESNLKQLAEKSIPMDKKIKAAVENICKSKGQIKISELTRLTGMSERQFEREFDKWVGIRPKIFCANIRFEQALQLLKSQPERGLLNIALESGYHDQAHLVADFKKFRGKAPSQFKEIARLLKCRKP